jgi:hypothetical protein
LTAPLDGRIGSVGSIATVTDLAVTTNGDGGETSGTSTRNIDRDIPVRFSMTLTAISTIGFSRDGPVEYRYGSVTVAAGMDPLSESGGWRGNLPALSPARGKG